MLPRPALAACLLALAACGAPEPAGELDPPGPPGFVLIVIDTLRLDRLGFAGYAPARTPHLDALRREGVWFADAYSTSSWTLHAMASLFTAQLGSQHGVVYHGSEFPERLTSVAEVLRDAGYRTAGWSANRWLAPKRGFRQGFEHYKLIVDPRGRRLGVRPGSEASVAPAAQLSGEALAWLGRHVDPTRPFFAFLHYMEPHSPYACPETGPRDEPEPGAARAAGDPDCAARAKRLNDRIHRGEWQLDPAERDFVSRLYDADVALADRALGRILAGLEAGGFLERAWVVVTADHGELLGEHGAFLHGKALYESLVRVPLLFRPPRQRAGPAAAAGLAGLRVDGVVSLIDVAPTLLDLAGAPVPASFAGRSLRPALEGRALAPRPAAAEFLVQSSRARQRFALVTEDEKLVMDTEGAISRYRPAADPGEERPRPASREEWDGLARRGGIGFDLAAAAAEDAPALAGEDREALEALGYVR